MDGETKRQLVGVAATFVVASEKDGQGGGGDVALAGTVTRGGGRAGDIP